MNKMSTFLIIKKEIKQAKKNNESLIRHYGSIPKDGTIKKLLKEGYRCFDTPSIFGDAIYTITWDPNYTPSVDEFEFTL